MSLLGFVGKPGRNILFIDESSLTKRLLRVSVDAALQSPYGKVFFLFGLRPDFRARHFETPSAGKSTK